MSTFDARVGFKTQRGPIPQVQSSNSTTTAAVPDELVRSSELWYDDGTVVMQAGRTLFRVYYGILQEQSQVFKHMFQNPQPTDAPLYDGVPLVQVEDSPSDLKLLLKILHQWKFRCDLTPLPFKDCVALALLCDKYCMDDMKSWALTTVKKMYRLSTFEDFVASSSHV